MKYISKFILLLYTACVSVVDRILAYFYKKQMISCGSPVLLKPLTSVIRGVENMQFGDHVRIARYAVLYSTEAKIIIGNKVGIAPKVNIITGNHRIDVVGKFIMDSHEKLPENDKDVILEDEIWIGVNVTILSGTVISRGSCVAANALLNKKYPPYAIIGGVPAKVLKFRFTIDEIIQHEKELYPPERRYSRQELISYRESKSKKNTKELMNNY